MSLDLRVESLSFGYGNRPVLKEITRLFASGQIHAVLGVNGSGKTTLLKLLNGFLRPWGGTVFLGEDVLHRLPIEQVARKVGYVPQHHHLSTLTVTDYLLLGCMPRMGWRLKSICKDQVFEMVDRLNLSSLVLRPLSQLSGGELQKVVIARALVQRPKVLILDEPTSNLDLKNQLEVMEVIFRETLSRDLTTVVAMHDVNLALKYATSFTLLRDGKILAAGGRQVITSENMSRLYGVEVEVHWLGERLVVMPR